jgi:hypothetical protein
MATAISPRGLLLALAAVLLGAPCAAAPAGEEILESVGVKDARDQLTQAGATVSAIDYDQDGFTITATLTADRHVWFQGMNCTGRGEATSCTEFKISAGWQLKTPAEAEALAKKLDYNYTSVAADGVNLELWRMDFTYGGITREHLRQTVLELLALRQQAEGVIWPSAGGPTASPSDHK